MAYYDESDKTNDYSDSSSNVNTSYNTYNESGHSPTQIMIFGIISLASGFVFGWTIFVGIVAIVFGALAISWANRYNATNMPGSDGQVTAGKVCGIIGLVFGIIGIIIGLFVFMGTCAAIGIGAFI